MGEEARLLTTSAAIPVGVMAISWLVSLRTRNAGIADVVWGPGLAGIALLGFLLGDGYEPRRALVLGLAAVWGLRLGLHIGTRSMGRTEDFRYALLRERYGERFGRVSMWRVFGVQAAAMWVISLPLQYAHLSGTPERLTWLDALGTVLWLVGFTFETVGDAQLRRFKADPANARTVMDRGLWRFTRHPNYFGEVTIWWGFFVIALTYPEGWETIVSPIGMTFVLVRITGVRPIERHMIQSKPGYAEYASRTSALFPLLPKPAEHGSSRRSL